MMRRWLMAALFSVSALGFVACDEGSSEAVAEQTIVLQDFPRAVANLEFKGALKVGMNPFVLKVRSDSGPGTAPVEGLQMTFVTDMPSMGHGSDGNIQPTEGAPGQYEGSANFTMAGDWRLIFEVDDGHKSNEVIFDLVF